MDEKTQIKKEIERVEAGILSQLKELRAEQDMLESLTKSSDNFVRRKVRLWAYVSDKMLRDSVKTIASLVKNVYWSFAGAILHNTWQFIKAQPAAILVGATSILSLVYRPVMAAFNPEWFATHYIRENKIRKEYVEDTLDFHRSRAEEITRIIETIEANDIEDGTETQLEFEFVGDLDDVK